jgi:hypothetical protein
MLLCSLDPDNVGRMEEIRAIAIERGLSFNELSEQIGKGLIPLGKGEKSNYSPGQEKEGSLKKTFYQLVTKSFIYRKQ